MIATLGKSSLSILKPKYNVPTTLIIILINKIHVNDLWFK